MLKSLTSVRILIALVGIAGSLFFGLAIPIVASVILALFWRASEVMIIGLLLDFAWSPAHSIPYFTLGAICLVWVLEPIRNEFLAR